MHFLPRVAASVLRTMCKASLQEAFSAAGGQPGYPPGPPPATHPPPPCLCSERGGSAAARDLPLICPFITLHTIRGSLEGCGDAGRWKTKRENKGTALRRPKGRCLLPLLPCWPGLGHPQAAGDLPHPCGPASDLM